MAGMSCFLSRITAINLVQTRPWRVHDIRRLWQSIFLASKSVPMHLIDPLMGWCCLLSLHSSVKNQMASLPLSAYCSVYACNKMMLTWRIVTISGHGVTDSSLGLLLLPGTFGT